MSEKNESVAEFLLIRGDPPCRKCRATEALLEDLAAELPGRVTYRVIRRDDPEATAYGAVLTPMLVLDGKVVCAGMVPVKKGLVRLLERAAGSSPPGAP